MDTREIIEGIVQKRNTAVGKLYDLHSPAMLGVCLRYCGNREDAEDVLHEGFLKILNNIKSFRYTGKGSPEAWMKRIMVNTALNFLRKRKKNVMEPDLEGLAVEEEEEDFYHLLREQISGDEVLGLIAKLPDGYRAVFNLYVFENYSHREIASAMNFTETTSKSQLSKARALLRKEIETFILRKNTAYAKERKPA